MAAPTAGFLEQVASPRFCERLFAHLPDVVFCLKDRQRRYQAANPAFAARLGLKDPRKLLGRTAEEFFPEHLAAVYREQDLMVLGTGREIIDHLELVTNRDGTLGWYLASKVPLHNAAGDVIGLASVSRDLGAPSSDDPDFPVLQRLVSHIRAHPDEPLRPDDLAEMAGLSPAQLDRRMRRVFRLSTSAFVRKVRIEHAAQLLATTATPIAEVALACGYGDQTAFTRQFHATVGLPPAAWRENSKRHV
jgi:PAS domain S-box-containing protein